MKKVVLGLMTIAALGTVSLPAIADEVNVQNSSQVSTQDGDYNSSFQRSTQNLRTESTNLNIESRRRARNNSRGNVQDARQDSLQRGYDNFNDQVTEQRLNTTTTDVEIRSPRNNNRRSRRRRR